MIRRTVTASALFLAMAAGGGDTWIENSEWRDTIGAVPGHSLDRQHGIAELPGWTQRWATQRLWITTPANGEHLALWFRAGATASAGDPQVLLQGFIPSFAASATSPSTLGGFAAERVIGTGASPAGLAQIGIAILAPTPTGTLILASRGDDAGLPARFRDLLVFSTLV